ncbi:ApeA N-terminal domain 1-containing protein [Mycobacteroides salmoniphilum]|uniref:ApeA N-terminal domain 1-containing protein n=1 Tax=Mycobacteroides salmoniphilum TaxID=404941 RepID=UPI0012FF8FFA|nr:HEPN domain-containing protein [Mycobacteroides salmoniphilum]
MTGWFHLPEPPSSRVPGVLNWQPDGGVTLELIGGFSGLPKFRRTDAGGLVTNQVVGDVRPGTILGESVDGERVSIWDAQRGRYTAGLTDGIREEIWHSSWMCIGAHIISPQEPAFTRATIAIDELYYLTDDGRFCAPQGTQIEGVEYPGETQPDGTLLVPYVFPIVGGYRAEYARADTADTRYTISTTATRPFLSPATAAMPDLRLQMMTTNLRKGLVVTLQVSAHASIRLSDSLSGSASDFVERIAAIDDLVQLATFEACGISQISLRTGSDEKASLLMHTGKVARPEDAHRPASVVFTLADVSLETFLQARRRFTDGNQAGYAWSVLVGLCGYSSGLVEEYVGQALAAGEGFHRWCLNGGGEVSLKDRLRALHDRLAPEVQAALGLDIEQWISWAVWGRNHVAHGGTKSWRQIRDYFELHAVAESVHLVTYLAALQELGVPVAKVRDALLNHPRLSVLAEQATQVNDLGEAD